MLNRYWLGVLITMFVGGCVVAGLQHWGNVEAPRAQEQQQRGVDTVLIADAIEEVLPEDAPPQIRDNLEILRTIGKGAQKDGIKSERWAVAGKKILNTPKNPVEPNTTGEDGVLAQHEQVAETLGKVNGAVNAGKKILAGAKAAGGLSGWVTGGGFMTVLAAVGTVAEVGRRKLKNQDKQRVADLEAQAEKRREEREEDRQRDLKSQEATDQNQDAKMDAFMTLVNMKLDALQPASVAAPSPPTDPETPA